MTPNLIGKHVAISDYPVHLVERVYSCRYNDIIYCRFKIPLRQGEFAYIEQAISDTSEHYIVVADRDKLLSAWRNTPNSIVPELSRGDEAAWRRDRKFHEAERCFSIGAGNPVPLATPTCRFILERGLPVLRLILSMGSLEQFGCWRMAPIACLFMPIITMTPCCCSVGSGIGLHRQCQ